MTKYNIVAKRETFYEFSIEANSEQEAIEEMNRIDVADNVEDYAYEWFPLEVTSIGEKA